MNPRGTLRWGLMLLAPALVWGCKKHEAGPAPEAAGQLGTNAPVVVVPDNGDGSTVLKDLSLQLRLYVMRSKKMPASYEEFVRDARVEAPPAPEGKKYAIAQGSVVLVAR